MWVQCDAGWGRIERIVSATGEVQTSISPTQAEVQLLVTLRPHGEAESICVDLVTRSIVFIKEDRRFACTRCQQFISHDLGYALNRHLRATHGGIGTSYRLIETAVLPLTMVMYRAQRPGDEWA